MIVVPIPCLQDNYAYLVCSGAPGSPGAPDDPRPVAIVVDPSESAPVERVLAERDWRLGAVLATHHHWDHVGGIADLARAHHGLEVYGYEGDASRIDGLTHPVKDGETRKIVDLTFEVRHIPGHTLGAIAWILDATPPIVFTGDTLFIAGCGRLFEGTPADMRRSLVDVLGSLPDDTLVYCGHEYTESNLKFAAHVEPSNPDIVGWQARASATRAKGDPTVPSTMGDERRINPFVRCTAPAIRAFAVSAGLDPSASDTEVLGAVRKAKDNF